MIKCTLEVFIFVVVSQLFLAVGLNELRVQVQLSLTFVTQPHVAQIRECCQREFQKMFKFGLEAGSLGNLLKKFFQTSKCSLLDRKSNIAKSQFLKI